MAYLFRAYSDKSMGTNKPTLFTPQAALARTTVTDYKPPTTRNPDLGKDLEDALGWKKLQSPFIFLTASLFFAVQVARSRKQKGESNVRITAINVNTAKTPDGRPVTFKPVPSMLREYAIRKENKIGEEYDYRDVFLATECIMPGANSRTVTFDLLEIAGLCKLYPALEWGFEREDGRTRLNRKTEDIRAFHFRAPQTLTMGRITVAVNLASLFVPAGRQSSKIDSAMMAHLLAFQKRDPSDWMLLLWLQEKTTAEVIKREDDEPACHDIVEGIDMEELKQFSELWKLFKDRAISDNALKSVASVNDVEIQRESKDWDEWSWKRRQEYQAKREARPDWDPNRQRRDREERPRSRSVDSGDENEDDRGARYARYAARRETGEWLPREEYVAKRDAHRAKRGGRARRGDRDRNGPPVSLGIRQPSGISKGRRYKK